jgi:hypothetical protein
MICAHGFTVSLVWTLQGLRGQSLAPGCIGLSIEPLAEKLTEAIFSCRAG